MSGSFDYYNRNETKQETGEKVSRMPKWIPVWFVSFDRMLVEAIPGLLGLAISITAFILLITAIFALPIMLVADVVAFDFLSAVEMLGLMIVAIYLYRGFIISAEALIKRTGDAGEKHN